MAQTGRPPSAKTLVDRQLGRNKHEAVPAGNNFIVPNHSGDHSAGTTSTPVSDLQIANKKYVDDNSGGTHTESSVDSLTNKTINSFTNDNHADDIHKEIRNESGSGMVTGDAVFASGYSIGQDKTLVDFADSTDSTAMPAIGIINETLANNATGEMVELGQVHEFDTSAWSVGDTLYISETGTSTNTLTNTKPTGSALIEPIAEVLRSHATLGIIEVFGVGFIDQLPNIADTKIWIGDTNGVPQEFALSGDATMTAGGVVTVTADEGTAVLSTGEGGGTKFLREDGDGTCSWQAAAGGGDVTAAANMVDNTIVTGDGGAKGVQDTGITIDDSNNVASMGTLSCGSITTSGTVDGIDIATDVAANTSKATNVTTNLSLGTGNSTTEIIVSSDGTDVTLIEADTDNAGLLGADKWDEIVAATTHVADNTQAHSDYLLNSGTDIAVGPLTITADNDTADQAYVPMILYNTDDTPPTASGFPIGTLYAKYTA